jgi:hypothetical protein
MILAIDWNFLVCQSDLSGVLNAGSISKCISVLVATSRQLGGSSVGGEDRRGRLEGW